MEVSDRDLYNYWSGCIVTYKKEPYKFLGCTEKMVDLASALGTGTIRVPFDDIDTTLPKLGWVRVGPVWVYLYRIPLRKIRKGYCQETLGGIGIDGHPVRFYYDRQSLLRQLWKKRRPHPELLSLPDGSVMYGTELVISSNGEDIVGKEKLSGYARSLLCAQSDN